MKTSSFFMKIFSLCAFTFNMEIDETIRMLPYDLCDLHLNLEYSHSSTRNNFFLSIALQLLS